MGGFDKRPAGGVSPTEQDKPAKRDKDKEREREKEKEKDKNREREREQDKDKEDKSEWCSRRRGGARRLIV